MIGLDIGALLAITAIVAMALALPVALLWTLFKILQGLFWVVASAVGLLFKGLGAGFQGVGRFGGHLGGFVKNTAGDALRLVGDLLTAVLYCPLVLLNVCLGRWTTANHYGRALEDEIKGAGLALYRLGIGNPARLLGLGALTEGVERRLPEVMARAPRGDRPRGLRQFDGYKIVRELPRGGSGAYVFVADTSSAKRASFASAGRPYEGQVVLKTFSLDEGSTLPQIVRESRALEAARDMGLVLDHELTDERFYYAMPFVPGEDLGAVTHELHAQGSPDGLGEAALREALFYTIHVLETLEEFHSNGLWHKDIKPNNVIVSSHRAHLVDLGLVTPLRSAMTLTTHGTEYFRDPEMVRLAMRGVKVQDVDGVKFDIYSVGALLYSLVENNFPAHGSLSSVSKRCPEAVVWIIRRAMADMGKRYASAREMHHDLRAVLAAQDPHALKPAALPSIRGTEGGPPPLPPREQRPDTGQLRKVFTATGGSAESYPEEAREAAVQSAKKRKARSKVRMGVLAALLLGLLFAGGLFQFPRRALTTLPAGSQACRRSGFAIFAVF